MFNHSLFPITVILSASKTIKRTIVVPRGARVTIVYYNNQLLIMLFSVASGADIT